MQFRRAARVVPRGILAPLLFVSPAQINFQVPWTVQFGAAETAVTLSGGSTARFFRPPVSAW